MVHAGPGRLHTVEQETGGKQENENRVAAEHGRIVTIAPAADKPVL